MAGQSSNDAKGKREKLVAAPDTTTRADKRRQEGKDRSQARRKAYDRNRRQWMVTRVIAGLLAVAIVGGIVAFVVINQHNKTANAIPSGVIAYTDAVDTARTHDDSYNAWPVNPPVGGTHNNVWQNCGYYSVPIGTGHGVHSLEHGAIWITYQPDLPQAQIDTLKALADNQDYILVSPFPGIPSPIVVTAWDHQMPVQTASDPRIAQFIKVFKNNSTYTPEFGALCSNGTSINGAQATQTAVAAPTAAPTVAVTPTP